MHRHHINVQTHRRYPVGVLCLAVLALCLSGLTFTQTPPSNPADKPFAVEYYYKAQWGYQTEFIRLYKKNHYPILKKQMEEGRILQVIAVSPRYHATEDGRWDCRVTIVWKNATVANDNYDSEPIIKQLFPDRQTFDREEQRRFEILLAHWDVPIVDLDLTK
jgi:hypothetical protein